MFQDPVLFFLKTCARDVNVFTMEKTLVVLIVAP